MNQGCGSAGEDGGNKRVETETTGWKMVLEILGEGEIQESMWVSGFSNSVTGGTFI